MDWKRAFALSILAESFALAQTDRATITGLVTDAQGARVAGAQVSAKNTATGVVSSTRTNEVGLYSLPNLEIGAYSLAAEHDGFRRYVHTGVTLTTGEVRGVDIQLQLGQVNESVSVTGELPMLESRESDVGQLLESKSIANLPLSNNRTLFVVQLTSATTFVNDNAYSMAGGWSGTQMFWLDGGSVQNQRLGVAQQDSDPPMESVQEIKVLANNYAAEYGAGAGGVIIMATKSGTNQFHGSLYEFLRNNKMDAPGFFAPVQNGSKVIPKLRYNTPGGSISGPIRRNKTFFYANYEAQVQRTGATSTLTVPTSLQRAGDFSQTFNAAGNVIPIYDPATTQLVNGSSVRTLFPGNRIPANRLDAVATKVMTYYPLPNRAPDSITGANNFRANYVGELNANFFMGKIDHSFSDRDRLTGRYFYSSGSGTPTAITTVYPDKGADPTSFAQAHTQYVHADWTHIIGPAIVNDVRFTYNNSLFHQMTGGVGGNYPAKLGLTGVSDNAFPHFAPSGFSALGSATQERRQYPIENHQYLDDLSWVRGRHSLKFGVEGRQSHNYEINLPTASGDFGFSTQATGLPGNATTGNGLASMLVGFPTSFAAMQTAITDRTSWYFAGFAQDQFTVSRSLTLNIGLRWETDLPVKDAKNRMNGFDTNTINPVSGTPGVVKFMGVNGYPTTAYDTDGNNFGPRFGFAWRPFTNRNTVVRGGYGLFYSHPFDRGQPAVAQLGFSQSVAMNTPDNGITAPFYLSAGVPAVATSTALNDSFGAVPVGKAASTAVTYFDRTRRTGYSQQFNIAVQQQLPGSLVLELTGLGNISHKLPGANLQIDQIQPQLLGPAHQSQQDRPFPQFSSVTILSPTIGDSRYFGGVVKVERRFAQGFNIVASYTYSQFLDNNDGGSASLGVDNGAYSNYYNRRMDWGPDPNDIRHHFIFSSVYELPFGNGKRWLKSAWLSAVAGGWSIGNVTNVRSGAPFTVVTQTNTTNSFSSGSLRANVVGDPTAGFEQGIAKWFNTAAFAQPAAFQFGNEGRDALRGPRAVNFDFSILRTFHVKERIGIQFRGELLNAFNHTNLSLPGSTLGAAGFGLIGAAGPARVVQLVARVGF